MLFRKIGILLSSLLFLKCNEGTPADYYSYLEKVKGTPKAQALDDSKLHVNCELTDRFIIKDLNKTENISFKIRFNGVPKAFPDDLSFQFLVDDKVITLPDSIQYTLRTSIDRTGKTFNARLSSLNVNEVIHSLKTLNNIPDAAYFINLSGNFAEIKLNNSVNPEKIKIELRAMSKGKVIAEKIRSYELKRPLLYKTRNRPFG